MATPRILFLIFLPRRVFCNYAGKGISNAILRIAFRATLRLNDGIEFPRCLRCL